MMIDIDKLREVTLKSMEIERCIEGRYTINPDNSWLEAFIGNSTNKQLTIYDVEALTRLFALLISKVVKEAVVDE